MRKFIAIALSICAIASTCVSCAPAEREADAEKEAEAVSHLYPKATVVSHLDDENDTVYIKDFDGYEWTFYGVEDWEVGDLCSVIMDDMGTREIFDDKIICTRYDGYIR